MTVVLLHPLPLDGSVWSDEMRALGPSVVAPTLYDLGDSIESWAGAVVDIAGPGPLVVVGNSIGGSCAIEVAYRVPERVKLIVLIGSKPGHRREPELRDAAVRLLAEDGMHAAWPAYWEPLFAPTADASIVRRGREIAFAQPLDAVDRGQAVTSLRHAEDAFARHNPRDTPPSWVRFFGATDLAAMAGTVHTELSRADRASAEPAIENLTTSIAARDQHMTRSRAFELTMLATNHLRAGNIDDGSRHATGAVALAEDLRSARVVERLHPLSAELSKSRHSEFADIRQRITSLVA